MTLPQVTSWVFLAAIAVMFNALLQPRSPAPTAAPASAPASTAEVPRTELAAPQPIALTQRGVIVPVARVAPTSLSDTWGQARSEGRSHEGIDIIAPFGAPVLAAVDGRVVKFFNSVRGGVTIYQFDRQERFVYYYAHLSARAADLGEGDMVRQGDVIGFVGQSGNAPVPHLHFEIQRLTAERHWWEAASLNPYPYLLSGRAPT